MPHVQSSILRSALLPAALSAFAQAQVTPRTALPLAIEAVERQEELLDVGDVDGDGADDLVFRRSGSNELTLRKGPRLGRWQPPELLPSTGAHVLAVELVDLDGDGDLDLVGATIDTLWIALNRGAAEFGAVTSFSKPILVGGVVTGDIDGDGDIDVVGGGLTLLGDGLGGFVRAPSSRTRVGSVLVDVDGDGRADLIRTGTEWGASFAVERSLGGGVWAPPERFGHGPVTDLQAADMDGDGDMDLVCARSHQNAGARVFTYFNDGAGRFETGHRAETELLCSRVCLLDLDGDGDLDVAACRNQWNLHNRSIEFLLNDGSGRLSSDRVVPIAPRVLNVEAGDVDGDGDLELLVDCWPSIGGGVQPERDRAIAILEREHQASWLPPIAVEAWYSAPDSAADFDGDGWIDLAARGPIVQLSRGVTADGQLSFSPAMAIAPALHDSLVATDFDGDGNVDLLGTRTGSGEAFLWRNRGAADFEEPRSLRVPAALRHTWADVNGDGLDDLLAFDAAWFQVLENQGDGRLGLPAVYPALGTSEQVVDLDGDGRVDVLRREGPSLWLHRGWGGGGFESAVALTLDPDAGPLEFGDIDGDGALDALSMTSTPGGAESIVYWDAFRTTFQQRTREPYRDPWVSAGLVDVNQDGVLDLLAGGWNWTAIALGDRSGRFEVESRHSGNLLAASARDFDRDGLPDLRGAIGAESIVAINRTR